MRTVNIRVCGTIAGRCGYSTLWIYTAPGRTWFTDSIYNTLAAYNFTSDTNGLLKQLTLFNCVYALIWCMVGRICALLMHKFGWPGIIMIKTQIIQVFLSKNNRLGLVSYTSTNQIHDHNVYNSQSRSSSTKWPTRLTGIVQKTWYIQCVEYTRQAPSFSFFVRQTVSISCVLVFGRLLVMYSRYKSIVRFPLKFYSCQKTKRIIPNHGYMIIFYVSLWCETAHTQSCTVGMLKTSQTATYMQKIQNWFKPRHWLAKILSDVHNRIHWNHDDWHIKSTTHQHMWGVCMLINVQLDCACVVISQI